MDLWVQGSLRAYLKPAVERKTLRSLVFQVRTAKHLGTYWRIYRGLWLVFLDITCQYVGMLNKMERYF